MQDAKRGKQDEAGSGGVAFARSNAGLGTADAGVAGQYDEEGYDEEEEEEEE